MGNGEVERSFLEAGEEADDGDDDQQFDEGERRPARSAGVFGRWKMGDGRWGFWEIGDRS